MKEIKLTPVLRQFVISVIANFTYLHMGMSTSAVSPIIAMLKNENQTVLPEPLSDVDASWFISVSFLSTAIALWFSSQASNYLGRKMAILMFSVPRLMMCFLLLFASQTWMLILARGLNGISDTMVALIAAYTSEIASTKIRGAISVISYIMLGMGVMFMLSVGPYTSYLTLQIIMTCVIFGTSVPLLFIPESPYYLYSKGQHEECMKILTTLRESTSSAQEELIEYSLIKEVKLNKKDLFSNTAPLKATGIVVIVLSVGSQAMGYNTVLLNLQSIYEKAKTNVSPGISSLICGCIQLLGAVGAVLVTDKLGRKPLFAISLIGYAVGMFGLGLFFKLTENGDEILGTLNYLPLISIMLLFFCNNFGIGSLIFTVMSELFEGPLRSLGVSVGEFIAITIGFLSNKYYYLVVAGIGPASTYWMFSGVSILTCLFIVFCVPETKGKQFSQIQKELGRKEDSSRA